MVDATQLTADEVVARFETLGADAAVLNVLRRKQVTGAQLQLAMELSAEVDLAALRVLHLGWRGSSRKQ